MLQIIPVIATYRNSRLTLRVRCLQTDRKSRLTLRVRCLQTGRPSVRGATPGCAIVCRGSPVDDGSHAQDAAPAVHSGP